MGLLSNLAERRELMTEQSKRIILVATPLMANLLSIAVHGNGFVSAFVCGVAFIGLRRSENIRLELDLLDDVGFLLTAVMWFVFGTTTVIARSEGVPVGLVVFCLLALTVVRLFSDAVGAGRVAVQVAGATAPRLARPEGHDVDRVRSAGLQRAHRSGRDGRPADDGGDRARQRAAARYRRTDGRPCVQQGISQ